MKKLPLLLKQAAIVGIATVCSLSLSSAELVKGVVFAVKGDVHLVTAAGATVPVTLKTPLSIGTRIETGSDGVLAIVWMDGAHCVVEHNTTVSVDSLQLTEDAGKVNRKIALRLEDGVIVNELVSERGNSSYRVKIEGADFITNGTQDLISFSKSTVNGKASTFSAKLVVLSGQVESQIEGGTTTDTTGYHRTTFTVGGQQQKLVMTAEMDSQFGATNGDSNPVTTQVSNSDSDIQNISLALAQFGTGTANGPTDVGSTPGGGFGSPGGNGSGGGGFGSAPGSAGASANATAGPSTTGSTPLSANQFNATTQTTTPMTP